MSLAARSAERQAEGRRLSDEKDRVEVDRRCTSVRIKEEAIAIQHLNSRREGAVGTEWHAH
jgi:hypothetical protein